MWSKDMSRIKLNNVDLAWLRMDSPSNPMMITVLLQFRGPLNYDQFIENVKASFEPFRRFRQRILRPHGILARPYWEDDPDYCVEDHVDRLDLELPVDDAAVAEIVNRKMNTPLDFARPLWQFTVVDNHPDGSLMIARVHHCIADGISLMQVFLRMTQSSSQAAARPTAVTNPNGHQPPASGEAAVPLTGLQLADLAVVVPASSKTKSVARTSKPGSPIMYRQPSFAEILAASARIIFRRPDPPSILKGPLGKTKRVTWSEPFSLPEVKKIARYRHATVNDVLMAIASGAMRRYMDLHNDHPKRNVRAFILVNMRGHSIDADLGNKFGLVFLKIPLDQAQPVERLDAIKRRMDSLKASAEYAATYFILNVLGLLPEWIERLAILILDAKGTVVATNVPGPRHEVSLAGTPITSIKAWVPQSGRIGVGLSFISYNDQATVGLSVDAGLMPDPEKFLELYTDEFKALQAEVALSHVSDAAVLQPVQA
jgi:diacylglycerol O-acyltransferase